MYVDKPMRGHGLMQAIARVNRVFGDKPGGLVVDYLHQHGIGVIPYSPLAGGFLTGKYREGKVLPDSRRAESKQKMVTAENFSLLKKIDEIAAAIGRIDIQCHIIKHSPVANRKLTRLPGGCLKDRVLDPLRQDDRPIARIHRQGRALVIDIGQNQ